MSENFLPGLFSIFWNVLRVIRWVSSVCVSSKSMAFTAFVCISQEASIRPRYSTANALA